MNDYLKKEFYNLIKYYETVFDFIQDNAPDGIWYLNIEEPTRVWINNRFKKCLGYQPEDFPISDDNWEAILFQTDKKNISRDNPEKFFKETVQFRHKNGNPVIMECRTEIISDRTGKNKRLLVGFEQVKKKSHAKRVLKVYNRRLEYLLNNTTDILVEISADGVQKFISPSVKEYTGYEPRELKVPFSEVIHPDDLERVTQHFQEVLLQPGKIHRETYRHIHKTKGYVWMEATLQSFLHHPQVGSVICSVREISEQKRAEELIKQNEKQLNEAIAAKDKFLSIMAHDLRNPFNLLLGFTELNMEYLQQEKYARLPELGKYMRQSVLEGYALLNNLLEWARTQNGGIEFNPECQNLRERVETSASMLSNMAMNKEILVEKIFPKKTLVYADRYMFDTILRNLISNAIKYSNKGGRIKISGEETKNELIMRITDSGIGISSSVKNRIFRKEENFSTKGTDGETGTGLGLLITKEFVEKHGGRIGVESKQGKGTTIWFTLPYNKEAEKTWRNCRNTKSPEQILFK